MAKIDKKLQYWSTVRLNASGREVVANSVLISTCLYFLALWGRTKKGVSNVTSKIRNFYWSGTTARTRAGVAWWVCCLKRGQGGLNLLVSGEAVVALMTKWIITACEPGTSSFKTLLRHRLCQLQPLPKGKWPPSMMWFQQKDHKGSGGSSVWNRVLKSWKTLSLALTRLHPASFDEWLGTCFWWGSDQATIGPGLSQDRAAQLCHRGLRSNKDAWDSCQKLTFFPFHIVLDFFSTISL
jgi:hypothetical protein